MTKANEFKPTVRVVRGPGGKPFVAVIGADTITLRPYRSRSDKSRIQVPWAKLVTRTYWASLTPVRKPKTRRVGK